MTFVGFRLDPAEMLQEVVKEIQSLHRVYSTNPILGVEFETDEVPASAEELVIENIQDDIDIVNDDEQSDAFAVSLDHPLSIKIKHKNEWKSSKYKHQL